MARIRTIKPDFWTDDVVADLDPVAMLLYIGMWNFADDEGFIKDSVGQLRRQIFPDRGFDVPRALDELIDRGRVIRYDSDQGRVLHIPHFQEHQKISHPTPTKFTRVRPCGAQIPEDSGGFGNAPEGSALKGRKEGMGMEGKGATADAAASWALTGCSVFTRAALRRTVASRSGPTPARPTAWPARRSRRADPTKSGA